MSEIELLRQFFKAWEFLHSLPKHKGAPNIEQKEAAQHLVDCAHLVREWEEPNNNRLFVPGDNEYLAIRNSLEPKH